MAELITLRAAARDRAGKGAARATRRDGRVPGVLYGDKKPPVLIDVDPRELDREVQKPGFFARLLNVEVNGGKDRARGVARYPSGAEVPLAPMPGIIGVAPAAHGEFRTIPPGPHAGNIDVRDLTFTYGQQPVLRNINLQVRSGETVGIVGRTGTDNP